MDKEKLDEYCEQCEHRGEKRCHRAGVCAEKCDHSYECIGICVYEQKSGRGLINPPFFGGRRL